MVVARRIGRFRRNVLNTSIVISRMPLMSQADAVINRISPLPISPDEFRRAGHRLVDRVAEFLDLLPASPITRGESPSAIREAMGERGFTTNDVERIAQEVCGCNPKPFFDAYIRRAGAIDFNEYLRPDGLKMEVQWKKAARPNGTLIPGTRVGSPMRNGVPFLFLYPGGAWKCAGLRNGDQVLKVNSSADNLSNLIHGLHIGDHATVEVMRDGKLCK